MATIIERKSGSESTFRVVIRLAGHPIRTRTFKNRTQAKLWAQREEIKMRDGEVLDVTKEARRRTVAELIDAFGRSVLPRKTFHTQRNEKSFLEWWKARLGEQALASVTPEELGRLLGELAGERDRRGTGRHGRVGKSKQTVKHYRDTLDRVFKKAVEWRWLGTNPMASVERVTKINNQRVRFLADDELRDLLDAARESDQPFLHVVVVFALSTGARKGEILGLTLADIDLKHGLATFRQTKNAEPRRVHIRGHLLDLLTDHVRSVKHFYEDVDAPTQWLFPRADGLRPLDISKAWQTARQRAGIKDFRFHDLRHTAASYLAMNGATLLEIATVLGHRTLQMVQRYAHISERHTAEVVERMNKSMFKDESGS